MQENLMQKKVTTRQDTLAPRIGRRLDRSRHGKSSRESEVHQ